VQVHAPKHSGKEENPRAKASGSSRSFREAQYKMLKANDIYATQSNRD